VKEVPISATVDPDVLKAAEAYTASGARQVRVVIADDLVYVDGRDVDWMLARASMVFTQWRFQHFWSQVAIVAMLTVWPAASHPLILDGYVSNE